MDGYPNDWPEIRARVISAAQDRCEFCSVRNGEEVRRHRYIKSLWRPVREIDRHTGDMVAAYLPDTAWAPSIKVALNVAHLFNENKLDCDGANLVALCQYHHLSLDARRRRHQKATGQTATPSVEDKG